MTSHRQSALDSATRIANTLLMNDKIEADGIATKILKTADIFAEWLGPDPVKNYGGGQRREKPTYDKPCPVCQGEMYDLRDSKKNPKAPDARCKKATWNKAEEKYEGCAGVIWPPKDN